MPEDLLRCPSCREGFLRGAEDGAVRCGRCAAAYPLGDGVIDLLPSVPTRRSLAQAAMEFEPIVRIYESRLWRRSPLVELALGIPFARELAMILDAARPAENDSVLDLACGSGIYSRPFARRVPAGMVVGLDLSRPMLRAAGRLACAAHVENLLFVHASALDLPFPAGRFAVVNCCGAFHLFPDVPRALSEVYRVLTPGGRFTVAAFRRSGGRLSELANRFRRTLIGIDAFTSPGLASRLREAGFAEPRLHHARGDWQIMSAVKPTGA